MYVGVTGISGLSKDSLFAKPSDPTDKARAHPELCDMNKLLYSISMSPPSMSKLPNLD